MYPKKTEFPLNHLANTVFCKYEKIVANLTFACLLVKRKEALKLYFSITVLKNLRLIKLDQRMKAKKLAFSWPKNHQRCLFCVIGFKEGNVYSDLTSNRRLAILSHHSIHKSLFLYYLFFLSENSYLKVLQVCIFYSTTLYLNYTSYIAIVFHTIDQNWKLQNKNMT